MEGSISKVFSDKYMCKMENGVARCLNLMYYMQYVDNTYAKRKLDETDKFLNALNLHHLNIK